MALSDTDRQVLEWLRERRQDAEIAVRLGVNVGDARIRIERIRKELGARDRAELVASKAGTESGFADESRWRRPETAIPSAAPLRGSGRTFSRRSVLLAGAAGAGATAAATAGIVALSRGGGDQHTAAANMTPSPSGDPASTSSGNPVPTPHPGAAAVTEVDSSRWLRMRRQSREFIPGNLEHGICFVDASTGAMEVISLGLEPGPSFGAAYLSSDYYPRFVAVDPSFLGLNIRGQILDRVSDRAFSWDHNALRLRFLHGNAIIFEALRYPGASGFENHWFVFDAGLEPAGEISLADYPTFGQYPVALSLEGTLIGGFTVPSDRHAPLFARIDGSAIVRGDEPEFDAPLGFLHTFSSRRDGTFRATWAPAGITEQQLESLFYADWYTNGRLARSGMLHVSETFDGAGLPPSPVSPDGRYRVNQGSLGSSFVGLGDHEDWLYTNLDLTDDRPLFRVLSGNLNYGWGQHRRWLADSSAFIVEAADAEYPRDDYWDWRRHRRYYLISPDASIEPLPRIPDEFLGDPNDGSWLDQWGGPEPHPDNPDLLSYGRVLLYNRATGEWFGPRNPPFADAGDPWAGHVTNPNEMRFAWPIPEKGVASYGTILAPAVERPPFREQVTFVVSGAGDCLELRESPSSAGPILECLPNGSSLTLNRPPVEAPYWRDRNISEPPPAFYTLDANDTFQMYVHVRTQSGATGWVAIQYLDWAP